MEAIATAPEPADEIVSRARLAFLYLAPGVVTTVGFVVIARLTAPLGWPATLGLLLTWPVIGLPLPLAPFHEGRKLNGRWSLDRVILYRQPLALRHYAWLIPVLLVWTAVWSTVLFPLADVIRQVLFAWWPDWLNLSAFAQGPARYSDPLVWAIVVLSAVLNIVIPTVEELYFRGYLLPRTPGGSRWAPLVNASLFSLYHFWLPWDFFGRLVALLPVAYVQ
jgi:membrane protease YdiL (CAAX protease family)